MSNIDKLALRESAEKHGDDDILALLDELESVQKTSAARLVAIDTTHKMFHRERDRADAAENRSAELSQKADIYDMLRQDYELHGSLVDFVDWQAKRIAELEAREVVLPQRYSMLHRVDFDEPYHTEMVYKQHQVLKALHDAGVKVAAAAGKGDAS